MDFKPELSKWDGFINRVTERNWGIVVNVGTQPGYKKKGDEKLTPQGDYISFGITFPTERLKDKQVDALKLLDSLDLDENGKPKKPTKMYFRGNTKFTVRARPKDQGDGCWVNLDARIAPWTEVSLEPFGARAPTTDADEPTMDDLDF